MGKKKKVTLYDSLVTREKKIRVEMARSRPNVRSFSSSNGYMRTEESDSGCTLTQVNSYGSETTTLLTRITLSTDSSDHKVGKHGHRTLCHYHDLPEWQKDNDFITHGYVLETHSLLHCLDTLFFFNNETVNIFSHFIPGTLLPLALLFVVPYAFSHSNFISYIPPFLVHLPAYTTNDKFDSYIFGIFMMGVMTCLTCSATFHTLKVHSERVAAMGSKLDYAGIMLLIASSLIGIVHYSLVDHPIAQTLFTFIISTIGLFALFITWHPNFRSSGWRHIRTSTFVSFSFLGLMPIAYGFWCFELGEVFARTGLKYILLEALSYLSGAAIYAFRLPERWIPGKVNMIGNSHQLFHFLVVLGAWCHFNALVASYNYAKSVTLGGSPL